MNQKPTQYTELQPALPWLELEKELRHETPRQWAKRLKRASNNEFNMLQLILARHATNNQIKRLFYHLTSKGIQNKNAIDHWGQTLTRLAPNIFDYTHDFKIQEVQAEGHFLTHYTYPNNTNRRRKRESPITIIGFTGNAGLLMAPIPCVLAALSRSNHDLVVIRRHHKEGYHSNNSKLLLSISQSLKTLLKGNLKESIALGTSGGGLAAACIAHALKLRLGIALGAGATTEVFHKAGILDKTIQQLRQNRQAFSLSLDKTRILLAASEDNLADSRNALLISGFFNSVCPNSSRATGLLFSECSNHNLVEDLSHKNVPLEDLLAPLFREDLAGLPNHLAFNGTFLSR